MHHCGVRVEWTKFRVFFVEDTRYEKAGGAWGEWRGLPGVHPSNDFVHAL